MEPRDAFTCSSILLSSPGIPAAIQAVTYVFRQFEAHCAVPQAGIDPLAMGVIKTAKVRPLFSAPADRGSKLIPAPVSVVPVMFVLVEFVNHPEMEEPVGHAPAELSL